LIDFRKPSLGSETLYYINNPYAVFGDFEIEKAMRLFGQYDYSGAKEKLEELREKVSDLVIRQQLRFSYMMMIQSEAQLQAAYGEDGQTIISSADTYLYLGGNDLQTAQAVAMRGDIPLDKILSLPIGECIIFRRGSRPVQARTFRLDEHRDYFQVKENSKSPMIKHSFFR